MSSNANDPWVVFFYEAQMYVLTRVEHRRIVGTKEPDQIIMNALVESALLHMRVLVDIILSRGSEKDTIRLEHLIPQWSESTDLASAVESLKRGMSVHVGDRVETSANGHVHLRFIDNAALSVRPDSVLEIQAYHFDANRPELSEVRLQVDQGVARSISGKSLAMVSAKSPCVCGFTKILSFSLLTSMT